jgi:hypothetical protein
MEGYGAVFAPIRWLALRRGDLDGVRRWLPTTMPPPTKNWRRLSTFAARLDGLAALDKADAIERETAPLLDLGSFIEPWATRALAASRRDDRLLDQAAVRLETLGLDWHAAVTRGMRGSDRSSTRRRVDDPSLT